jgi:hypothetical protein
MIASLLGLRGFARQQFRRCGELDDVADGSGPGLEQQPLLLRLWAAASCLELAALPRSTAAGV